MSEERLIKKYPNRRLYDTSQSAYVTLDEVRQLVIAKIPFRVIEKKTGNDLTRSILMQIIMEQEADGAPMFNVDMLIKFIQNYGTESQQFFTDFMDQSLNFFVEQQATLSEQLNNSFKGSPVEFWAELGQNQLQAWQEMQAAMLGERKKKS